MKLSIDEIIFCREMVFKFGLAKLDYCFAHSFFIYERLDHFLLKMFFFFFLDFVTQNLSVNRK